MGAGGSVKKAPEDGKPEEEKPEDAEAKNAMAWLSTNLGTASDAEIAEALKGLPEEAKAKLLRATAKMAADGKESTPTAIAIPHLVSDVTADWLTGVLREAKLLTAEEKVATLETKQLGEGRGYMCATVRLSCVYSPATPASTPPGSFVIKIPNHTVLGAYPMEPGDIKIINDIYAQENFYYARGWSTRPSGVLSPKFYWCGALPQEDLTAKLGDYAVLIEDLGEDLELLSQAETGTDLPHAQDFVRSLARLHAHWWEEQEELKTNPLDEAWWHDWIGQIFEKKWEAFWSTVSGEEAGKKVPLIPEAVEALKLFNADMSKGGPRKLLGRSGVPKGLTHGDARVENMIWRNLKSGGTPGATGKEAVLLDFQIIHRGCPVYDLSYFLSQSLNLEQQKAHTEELLLLYYETLTTAEGTRCEKAKYDYETFLRDFKLELLPATCMAIDCFGSLPDMLQGYEAIEDKSSQEAKEMEGFIEGVKTLGFCFWERSQNAIQATGAAKEVTALLG